MKSLARGYIHLVVFFLTLYLSSLLIMSSNGTRVFIASLIYSGSLIMQYGVSALYHSYTWSQKKYLLLRRIDHAAIFVLIAGSATPICLLKLKSVIGLQLLTTLWLIAIIGMLMTTMWPHLPKWSRTILYVFMGWVGIFYYPEIQISLNIINLRLLMLGGVAYTLGGLIYAFKWPDPFPTVFGYHEVFHILVVLGSGFHFALNYNIATTT